MSIATFKDSLIPKIKTFAGVPVIEADQTGNRPDGSHVAFKITSPYIKERGQAETSFVENQSNFTMIQTESFKRVLSFTAYDMDNDISFDLAQQIHDWFDFYGQDSLSNQNIVVVEITSTQNRDAFIMDGYERQNGFDVTLRMTRELQQDVGYFDHTDLFDDVAVEYIGAMEATGTYFTAVQPIATAGTAVKVGQATIL